MEGYNQKDRVVLSAKVPARGTLRVSKRSAEPPMCRSESPIVRLLMGSACCTRSSTRLTTADDQVEAMASIHKLARLYTDSNGVLSIRVGDKWGGDAFPNL